MNSSSYINFGNNLTINNSDSLDNEKMGNMFIYSKKNIKDLKSMMRKNLLIKDIIWIMILKKYLMI